MEMNKGDPKTWPKQSKNENQTDLDDKITN